MSKPIKSYKYEAESWEYFDMLRKKSKEKEKWHSNWIQRMIEKSSVHTMLLYYLLTYNALFENVNLKLKRIT